MSAMHCSAVMVKKVKTNVLQLRGKGIDCADTYEDT